MDRQNVTLSIPKEVLRAAKHAAVERGVSLSRLLMDALLRIVRDESQYDAAKRRQLRLLASGLDLGTHGKVAWSRSELHER